MANDILALKLSHTFTDITLAKPNNTHTSDSKGAEHCNPTMCL